MIISYPLTDGGDVSYFIYTYVRTNILTYIFNIFNNVCVCTLLIMLNMYVNMG
jgi:hypothetical protein